MTTEQQDLAWACLPKEVREEKRKEYRIISKNPRLDRGDSIYLTALDNIFGHHNLTSDTEPSELLFVERKRVQTLYSQLQDRYKEIKTKTIPKNIGQGHDYVVSERGFVNGAINELKLLFGDKCLPDKTPEETAKEIVDTIKEDIENPIQLPETILMPQPKFNKEDLVGLKGCNTIIPLVIDGIFPNKLKGVFDYTLMGAIGMYSEDDLELYKSHKQEQPSVQVEPKFKVRDKVIHNHKNREVGEVAAYFPDEKFCYSVRFGKEYHNMAEHQLEPYTEPEIKPLRVGDKVKVKGEDKVREIFRILPDGRIMFGDKGNTYSAEELKLVEPETKDNMEKNRCEKCKANAQQCANSPCQDYPLEEKELNLLYILSDSHIGETFYSLIEGYVKFEGIEPHWKEYGMKPLRFAEGNFNPDGTYQTKPNASCCIWPSKELYEKYPLDPVKAWSIWASERKPKFNVKVIIECWQDNDDNPQTKTFGATYSSKEEAQQAAEAVRETLMKIHEQNQK